MVKGIIKRVSSFLMNIFKTASYCAVISSWQWLTGPFPSLHSWVEPPITPPLDSIVKIGQSSATRWESTLTWLKTLRHSWPSWTLGQPADVVYTRYCHISLLLDLKTDAHFTTPRRVEGWVLLPRVRKPMPRGRKSKLLSQKNINSWRQWDSNPRPHATESSCALPGNWAFISFYRAQPELHHRS